MAQLLVYIKYERWVPALEGGGLATGALGGRGPP